MALKITDPKAMDTLNAMRALLITEDGRFAVSQADEHAIGRLLGMLCEAAWEDDPRRMRALRSSIFAYTAALDLIDHRVADTVIGMIASYLAA